MQKRKSERGSAILFLVIILAVIGGGFFYLNHLKQQSIVEGRDFARTFIERVVSNGDLAYLHSVIAGERRLAINPGKEAEFVETCKKLGKPSSNYDLTGDLAFSNYFFSPEGSYKAILTYPDRHATASVKISRPSGFWFVDDFGITWERPAE